MFKRIKLEHSYLHHFDLANLVGKMCTMIQKNFISWLLRSEILDSTGI